jgi:hypothetical protein
MLAHERARLHVVPDQPHTVAFGLTRQVPASTPMVTFEGGQYSVPHTLLGQRVWVRVHGAGGDERVVIVHVSPSGPVEVARHARATPGSPRITDAHFPPAPTARWTGSRRSSPPRRRSSWRLREGDDVRGTIERLGEVPPPSLATIDAAVQG